MDEIRNYRGSTPLASSLRPADAGATAGTPAQKPTSSRTAFRLFGRGLSAIVRRPTNGGGPLIWPMRHSPFARLKQELRLARQLSLHGQKSYFVPAGRRLSGIVRRRPNVGGLMFTFTSFFLRPAAFDMPPPVSFLADASSPGLYLAVWSDLPSLCSLTC